MISIVIVNWNSGDLLRKCVSSLTHQLISKIIIVDNNSSDRSEIINHNDKVILIKNKKNLGFGKACNIGAKQAKSKYILFLNPDTVVLEKTLDEVFLFMEHKDNQSFGICGVKLIDDFGQTSKSCSRFPSGLNLLAYSSGLSKLIPKLGPQMIEWNHDETREVEQVIGAFFFIRDRLFKELGGFDEQFFVYYEEVDFSLRAKKIGYKSIYLANSKSYHTGGGTSNKVKGRRLFYLLRSRLKYSNKHFNLAEKILTLFSILIIEFTTRVIKASINRSTNDLKETSTAYFLLYKWMINKLTNSNEN